VGAAAKARALTLVRMSWLTQSESAALSPLDQIADLLPAPPAGVILSGQKQKTCEQSVHSVIVVYSAHSGTCVWCRYVGENVQFKRTHWPRWKTRPSTTVPTQASLDDDSSIHRSVGRAVLL